MVHAIGIDLGGTKIETQVFDATWEIIARKRIDTPGNYGALVDAMASQIAWAQEEANGLAPVGIGAAGLISPISGNALTANLVATGHPFPSDIAKKSGCDVLYINDCRALTLSEAVFGAAIGMSPVVGLILGTGVGGGAAVQGKLIEGPGNFGGEFGHLPAPAHLVSRYELPLVKCGCGRIGCIETFIAGPGLERLAKHLTGKDFDVPTIAAGRRENPELELIWNIWVELVADLLRSLSLSIDPEAFVIGGGLSKIDGLAHDLQAALRKIIWDDYPSPQIFIAKGGDSSGARGAAFAARSGAP